MTGDLRLKPLGAVWRDLRWFHIHFIRLTYHVKRDKSSNVKFPTLFYMLGLSSCLMKIT